MRRILGTESLPAQVLYGRAFDLQDCEALKHLLAHSQAGHIQILSWRLECKWGTVCVTYRSKTFHVMLLQFILSFNLTSEAFPPSGVHTHCKWVLTHCVYVIALDMRLLKLKIDFCWENHATNVVVVSNCFLVLLYIHYIEKILQMETYFLTIFWHADQLLGKGSKLNNSRTAIAT
jgi:hypothetical protein